MDMFCSFSTVLSLITAAVFGWVRVLLHCSFPTFSVICFAPCQSCRIMIMDRFRRFQPLAAENGTRRTYRINARQSTLRERASKVVQVTVSVAALRCYARLAFLHSCHTCLHCQIQRSARGRDQPLADTGRDQPLAETAEVPAAPVGRPPMAVNTHPPVLLPPRLPRQRNRGQSQVSRQVRQETKIAVVIGAGGSHRRSRAEVSTTNNNLPKPKASRWRRHRRC